MSTAPPAKRRHRDRAQTTTYAATEECLSCCKVLSNSLPPFIQSALPADASSTTDGPVGTECCDQPQPLWSLRLTSPSTGRQALIVVASAGPILQSQNLHAFQQRMVKRAVDITVILWLSPRPHFAAHHLDFDRLIVALLCSCGVQSVELTSEEDCAHYVGAVALALDKTIDSTIQKKRLRVFDDLPSQSQQIWANQLCLVDGISMEIARGIVKSYETMGAMIAGLESRDVLWLSELVVKENAIGHRRLLGKRLASRFDSREGAVCSLSLQTVASLWPQR